MKIYVSVLLVALTILVSSTGCSIFVEKPPPPLEGPIPSFSDLCQRPTTIFCQDFDQLPPEGSQGTEGIFHNGGRCEKIKSNPREACPEIDEGALKFTVPSKSGGGASGQYFVRFSDYNDGKSIGPGEEVFIQWKQRFSDSFLNTRYKGGGGWKHGMVGAANEGSCSSNEIVLQNVQQRGFPQMYHACGKFQGFERRVGRYSREFQPGGPGGICSYSGGLISSGCTQYYPDEWLTYQIGITHGQPGEPSRIRLWVSPRGAPEQVGHRL